jgi:predicted membrane chloride channel (bestrophin family)
MSHTPVDSHFIAGTVDIDLLGHRPHKTAMLVVQAMTATAFFRVWPTLLFMGGWSTAIILINKKTAAELTVPSTMLTVLGVVLGLTLSYRCVARRNQGLELIVARRRLMIDTGKAGGCGRRSS